MARRGIARVLGVPARGEAAGRRELCRGRTQHRTFPAVRSHSSRALTPGAVCTSRRPPSAMSSTLSSVGFRCTHALPVERVDQHVGHSGESEAPTASEDPSPMAVTASPAVGTVVSISSVPSDTFTQ